MIGPVNGNGLGAIVQEQPAMAELATQNQALEQKNAALEKQHAAMSLMILQLTQQNARLAAANAGGSALLKETVQQLDNGQMARDAEIELLRQENTLLKAQQEEVNAQNADETQQKNGRIARLERRIAELEAKQQACQEFFQAVRTVSTSDCIIGSTTDGLNQTLKHLYGLNRNSPATIGYIAQMGRIKPESADALVLAVAKVQQDLSDICNQYRE
jgi:chromosome segregation ATPase